MDMPAGELDGNKATANKVPDVIPKQTEEKEVQATQESLKKQDGGFREDFPNAELSKEESNNV